MNRVKFMAISLSLSLSLSLCNVIDIGWGTGQTGNTSEQYDFSFVTSHLGHYQIEVESHEIPSKEILPFYVVGKDYFPHSTTTQAVIEVDNDAPSAVYNKQDIQKVDVIFATGELDQIDSFTNYMRHFESQLSKASNNFDVMVDVVETTTLDLNSLTPQEILNTWYNYPGLGGHYAAGWYATNDNKLTTTENVNWTGFLNWTDEAKETTDATYEFELTFEGSHQDPQGWTFRTTKHNDGSYSFYGVEVNQRYGNLNLYCITEWKPSTSYPTHGGPYYHGCISGCDGTYDGTQKTAYSEGATGFHLGRASVGKKSLYSIKIENTGNKISVYSDGELVIEAEDNTLKKGTYGPYTASQWEAEFFNIKVTTGAKKTLGEAIQDVAWRDNSVRFVIHALDDHPLEYDPKNSDRETDRLYTIAKLLVSNAYLINLGRDINHSDMIDLINSINPATPIHTKQELGDIRDAVGIVSTIDITDKGMYYNNYPITTAMNKSIIYITEIAKRFLKPSDWILVGTQLTWDTEYKDGSMNNGKPAGEGDYALNYGEHNGKNIPSSKKQSHDNWDATHDPFGKQLPSTLSITNEFRGEKILAERWRYRHYYTYFDNPTIQESYHNQWIQDPEEVFNNPGKFRINYKRLDNPLYQLDNSSRRDTSLTHLFAEYRRWSDNYDKEGYNTTPNMIPIENKN